MWIKAIDIVLDRLVVQGAELHTVAAVSGSAQQHGSLYWSASGIESLHHLDADKFLHTQLDDEAFTVTETPIWMDGSTEQQCDEMECSVGGREKMVECTLYRSTNSENLPNETASVCRYRSHFVGQQFFGVDIRRTSGAH